MAGRYLAIELQDENGDVLYPHTEADIVYSSDGTTVEENLSGEVTDADIQEIFGDSQVEAGKKLSVKEKIKKALKKYQTLLAMKILDTMEEVEANTDDGYLMGAKAGAELINDLGGLSFAQDSEGNWGYKPSGADTVIPFKSGEIIDLGTGTSWDISKYYSKYDKLTSDNFIVEVSSLKSSNGWNSLSPVATSMLLKKSYVSPTLSVSGISGTITGNQGNGTYANVSFTATYHAYLMLI